MAEQLQEREQQADARVEQQAGSAGQGEEAARSQAEQQASAGVAGTVEQGLAQASTRAELVGNGGASLDVAAPAQPRIPAGLEPGAGPAQAALGAQQRQRQQQQEAKGVGESYAPPLGPDGMPPAHRSQAAAAGEAPPVATAAAAAALLGPSLDAGLIAVSSDASLLSVGGGGGLAGSPAGGSSLGVGDAGNKTLYLGNLHPFVTEQTLQELFAGLEGVTELKVIKDKTSGVSAGYGFAKFADTASANVALEKVNKATVFGQEVRINWAFQKEAKEESGGALVHVFVGDLSSDVTDALLHQAFQACPGIVDARVMWDHATGRSRGYGFVSFRNRAEAEAAIQAMHGQFIGARRVRCGWAQHKTDNVVAMDPGLLDKADPTNTNVYVGNLAPELPDSEVRRQFGAFGPIAEVKLYRKGAYGFVRYKTHEDAVRAIVSMNGQPMANKMLKCSWGRHPGLPPSGVQTSLMLAAAAGVNPLAMGAAGMLGPGGGMPGGPSPHGVPVPLPLSPMMLGHGVGGMAGLGMPMSGAASQGLIHGHGSGGQGHLHGLHGHSSMGLIVPGSGSGALDPGGLGGGGGHGLEHMQQGGLPMSAGMAVGMHYGLPHPYALSAGNGVFGFSHNQQ